MRFERYIGIDYSGAETAESGLKALQVFVASVGQLPVKEALPAKPGSARINWSRQDIAEWLVNQCERKGAFIAGIDHGFSVPRSFLDRHGLVDWDSFLVWFRRNWPTDRASTYVDFVRDENPPTRRRRQLRLTEKWTSSAKSVFDFHTRGQVAKSTHAGIPWLKFIRGQVPGRVHFWPFDGWHIPSGVNVIAEVYPAILKRRYRSENRTADEHDAYSVARWLKEADERGILARYLEPPLTEEERLIASREGWILGVA